MLINYDKKSSFVNDCIRFANEMQCHILQTDVNKKSETNRPRFFNI